MGFTVIKMSPYNSMQMSNSNYFLELLLSTTSTNIFAFAASKGSPFINTDIQHSEPFLFLNNFTSLS